MPETRGGVARYEGGEMSGQSIPCEFVALSGKCRAVLERENIRSYRHLASMKLVDVIRFPGMGRKGIEEIKAALKVRGLNFLQYDSNFDELTHLQMQIHRKKREIDALQYRIDRINEETRRSSSKMD